MNALDFATTLWMTGFIGGLSALSSLLIAHTARGALPSVSRMAIANFFLTFSVIGRIWVGDDMTNWHYALLWSLWAATLLALISALRFSIARSDADRILLIGWLTASGALFAAAALFNGPQPTAIASCLVLSPIALVGAINAWQIPPGVLSISRVVLIGAFAATALGVLWHLPLRIGDLLNESPSINQTAYTYVMLLASWMSINIGLVMIQYARAIENVGSLAHTDQLTGLLNRHGLRACLREHRRKHQQLMHGALIMIDIDHFKQVNDRHGHVAGDAVLSAFAENLRRAIRKDDLLVRWGGEEFCLIMPGSSVDEACQRADRICERIARVTLVNRESLSLKITASLGVASLGRQGATLREDMQRADEALYAAKQNGRNRVERWSEAGVRAMHPYGPDIDQEQTGLTL